MEQPSPHLPIWIAYLLYIIAEKKSGLMHPPHTVSGERFLTSQHGMVRAFGVEEMKFVVGELQKLVIQFGRESAPARYLAERSNSETLLKFEETYAKHMQWWVAYHLAGRERVRFLGRPLLRITSLARRLNTDEERVKSAIKVVLDGMVHELMGIMMERP